MDSWKNNYEYIYVYLLNYLRYIELNGVCLREEEGEMEKKTAK